MEANADLATRFQIPPGTPILKRTFLTKSRREEGPLSIVISYQPWDQFAENPELLDVTNEPWPGGTMHQLSTIGIEVMKIVDEISTRPPTLMEAEVLDIDPGTSMFVLRKVALDADERVVDVTDVFMPGDRTELIYEVGLN
ncbi:MAG: UTRA domain-containing protein [Actinomycetota bacterium]